MKAVFFISIVSVLFPLCLTFQFQDPEIEPKQDPQIPVPQEGAVERRDFMRTKLLFTQNIFEGLITREWDLIQRGIKELEQVLEAEQWISIEHDEWRRQVDEFRTSLHRIKKSAESRNIEATSLRFYEMSTRCIDCHQLLKKGGNFY
jgi:hypothetical protein